MRRNGNMRPVAEDVIARIREAIAGAGFSCREAEPYRDAREMSVHAGRRKVGRLDLSFKADRFDALFWGTDGHIHAGRSGIHYESPADVLWAIADIERALRLRACERGLLPPREVPSDFVVDVLVHDVSRIPLPGEPAHAWAANGLHAGAVVGEAREIVASGDFDRERSLRFVGELAASLPDLDHARDGAGLIFMARRCAAAMEGRIVLPIREYEWRPSACAASPYAEALPDPEAERDAEPYMAGPAP